MRSWVLILACAAVGCAQPALLSCPEGELPCVDGCADPLTSNEHCGGCGNPCELGTTCQQGTCVPDQSGVCATANGGCSLDAQCMDVGGEAVCTCNPGFTGDGRTCAACTICDQTAFPVAGCTPVMDTVCQPCSLPCESGQWEAQPCGPLGDRVCATCTGCQLDQYEVQGCGPFNDTTCATCAVCQAGQYEIAPCGAAQNTVCGSCDVGCTACAGPGATCTACDLGFVLMGGACIPTGGGSCGDGVIDGGETCDDGNQLGGDGCDQTCAVESGWYCFGLGPSFCRAGTCVTDSATALPLGSGFTLDGSATASGAGLTATGIASVRTAAPVAYPMMIEADITFAASSTTHIGARGTGLRDLGAAGQPLQTLRARLSDTLVEFIENETVAQGTSTPFTVQTGVPYHVRYVDDGGTAVVEWYEIANPANGIAYPVGSSYHGLDDRGFIAFGDGGSATVRALRACSAPVLPVTSGLVARYSGIESWTTLPDPGGQIAGWLDQSGQGHDLAINGPVPVYSPSLITNHGGVSFAGGAGLFSPPFALTSDVTVFAVVVPQGAASYGAIVHHGDNDTDWSLEQSGVAPPGFWHFKSNSDDADVELTLTDGTPYILTGRIAGLVRYFSASGFDGAPPATATFTDGASSIVPGAKNLYVGTADTGEASNASIGTILYYDRALSDGERDQVIAYLSRLWHP